MYKMTLWGLIFMIFVSTRMSAQDFRFEDLENKLSTFSKNHPRTNIYLKTNKGLYETGEDLWFKAYVLDSRSHVPSQLDSTLYLEVVEEKKREVVWQEKYPIENGFVNGHIYIQDSLPPSNYLLMAYSENSFYDNIDDFKAYRRIEVKKNLIPALNVNLELDKPVYHEGDPVVVATKVSSRTGEPIASAELQLKYSRQNGDLIVLENKTENDGKTQFEIPSGQAPVDGKLLVTTVKDKLKVTNELSIPLDRKGFLSFNVFPEGGHLIAGTLNRLAFKAADRDGNPIEVSGTLLGDNVPITQFQSLHNGMGSMDFQPSLGVKYHIQLNEPSDSIYKLPTIKPEGIAIRLLENNEKHAILLLSANPKIEAQMVYIRAQTRGKVYALTKLHITDSVKIALPIKDMPQGISEVTVYNEKMVPMAERLVYINPYKRLNVKIEGLEYSYGKRQKVDLKIKVTDDNGNPVPANFGVSVHDSLYYGDQKAKNIVSHYYLNTQIRGKIYDPNYYFDKRNKDRNQALDLLLLTQGWRRYVWDEKQLEKLGAGHPVMRNNIFGRVAPVRVRDSIHLQPYVLLYKGEDEKIFKEMDDKGRIRIGAEELMLARGGYLYAKPMKQKEIKVRNSIDDPFEALTELRKTLEVSQRSGYLDTATDTVNLMVQERGTLLLDEVVVSQDRNRAMRDKYLGSLEELSLKNNPDYVCVSNVLNCPIHTNFRGNTKPVNGVRYRKHKNLHRIDRGMWRYYGWITLPPYEGGVGVSDAELLEKYGISRIKGYYFKREFYKVDHGAEHDPFPDHRNALLWEPNVITNSKGEASLSFFCSDVSSRFLISVEGVGNNGELGNTLITFDVIGKNPTSK